ncbi:hypothetical protein WA538_004800 [Blastocystis sp. DL]
MKLFRRFDYLPTVDSYFMQRSITGILFSVLAVLSVLFYNVAISFSSSGVHSSYSIDINAPNAVDVDVAFQSSNVPCAFMDIAVTDYYGYPLEQQTISMSPSSTEAYPFAKKLKSVPENILVAINKQAKGDKTCILPDAESPVTGSCTSCNDYVHLYSRLGYKSMKLIQGLTRCSEFTAADFGRDHPQCAVTLHLKAPTSKFLIHIDTSRFAHFFTSDEFEDESMLDFLQLFPTFTSFAINGQSVTPSPTLSPHSPRNLVRYDLDIRLVPTNQAHRHSYKAVSRVTEIPLSFLNKEETPGFDMAFDFAGIVADEKGSRWGLLNRLVVSGSILSCFGFIYLVFFQCGRRRRKAPVNSALHYN